MNDFASQDRLGWAWAVANHFWNRFPYFNRETRRAHLRLFLTQWFFLITVGTCVLLDSRSSVNLFDELVGIWNGRGFAVVAFLSLIAVLASGLRFFKTLYNIEDWHAARTHWLTSLFGLNYLPGMGALLRAIFTLTWPIHLFAGLSGFTGYEYLVIGEGKIPHRNDEEPIMKSGGPAFLIIYSDSAAVLEQDGCFTRVIGPGFWFLEPFETIREIVDLRPQVRFRDSVTALTKDGIPIQVRLEVEFMIQPGQTKPRSDAMATPYPFREGAVRRAVYNKSINHTATEETIYWWKELVIYRARSELRRLFNEYILDRLMEPEEADPRGPLGFADTPRREIQRKLRNRLSTCDESIARSASEQSTRLDGKDIGVTILRVTLGQLRIDTDQIKGDEEILKHRIKSWQAEWLKKMMITQAEGQAADLRLKETARAQAQAEMLHAIAQGLELSNRGTGQLADVLALRALEAMENMTLDPWAQIFMPDQILETLRKLRSLYS